jgi:hypothetical protein
MKTTKDYTDKLGYIYGFEPSKMQDTIQEISYADYLREYHSDETTSPRGVMPKLYLKEREDGKYEIRQWLPGGNSRVFDHNCDRGYIEDEAQVIIYGVWEENHHERSVDAPEFFDTKEEIEEWLREQGK